MATENISFNVLTHELVPEHYLLSEEEAQQILDKLKITKDQLPKIRKSDAAIKVLEHIYGPIEAGRVIKVVRKSSTAEEFTAYRLVTGS
ncbi:MAG: DNA-directed RNA polymerase subunit H [Candidatus Methanomethylophilaceae archaeon]|nr:DNA-directed RNA polymerase subunit H [Candidatus Methanomethylophilaceae archaeon]